MSYTPHRKVLAQITLRFSVDYFWIFCGSSQQITLRKHQLFKAWTESNYQRTFNLKDLVKKESKTWNLQPTRKSSRQTPWFIHLKHQPSKRTFSLSWFLIELEAIKNQSIGFGVLKCFRQLKSTDELTFSTLVIILKSFFTLSIGVFFYSCIVYTYDKTRHPHTVHTSKQELVRLIMTNRVCWCQIVWLKLANGFISYPLRESNVFLNS